MPAKKKSQSCEVLMEYLSFMAAVAVIGLAIWAIFAAGESYGKYKAIQASLTDTVTLAQPAEPTIVQYTVCDLTSLKLCGLADPVQSGDTVETFPINLYQLLIVEFSGVQTSNLDGNLDLPTSGTFTTGEGTACVTLDGDGYAIATPCN